MIEENAWPWPTTESMTKTWTARVIPDPDNMDECMLEFPEDLIARVGWKEGDTLNWDVRDDGTVVLTKKE